MRPSLSFARLSNAGWWFRSGCCRLVPVRCQMSRSRDRKGSGALLYCGVSRLELNLTLKLVRNELMSEEDRR
ncbi:hypothetical protein VTL71DRAFT_15468 [Oculimacula yallundae]|uniref:Secreted protein n=1 Tax=Oculimacula yallundae TaxID=86028 RepID=A0ABR4CHB4_9HELO